MAEFREKDPEKWKDYKLILGNEIYLCSRKEIEEDKNYTFYHFILIAKDEIGHKQIRELSTRAWIDNSFTWVNIRTPTYYDDLFEVVESNRGHLVASTGCLGGFAPHLILRAYNENPLQPDYHVVKKWLSRMDQCFGHGNFFLELQPSIQEEQKIVNQAYIELSKELDIPYIITTDAHYLKKEDRPIHEAFLKSNDDSGKEREVGDFYASTYVMSEEEIHSYMDEYLEAEAVQQGIDNTMLIYNMVQEYTLFANLEIPYEPDDLTEPNPVLVEKYVKHIPMLDWFVKSDFNGDRHLVREIVNRIEKDKDELANKETYDAIQTCLESVKASSEANKAHWSAYLLQTRDLVNACWEVGSLVGPSRGCFVPDSMVLMGDGTQKPIQDVKIGDVVVTHLGNIRKVKNVFCYDVNETMSVIKGKGNNSITCTNNHEFWIKNGGPCNNPKYRQKWCTDNCRAQKKNYFCNCKFTLNTGWEKAENLKEGSQLSFPIIKLPPQTIKKIDLTKYFTKCFSDNDYVWMGRCNHDYQPLKKHPRYLTINADFAYVAGVFLGDGWVRSNGQEIGFAFNSNSSKEQESLKRVKSYFENLGYYTKERNYKNNLIQLIVCSKLLNSVFTSLFGHNAYDKKIPSLLWVDSHEIVGSLLDGLMNSDGSYDIERIRLSYDSVNYNLISQVKTLFGFMGILGNIAKRIPKDTREAFKNSKISYKFEASGKQLLTIAPTFLTWAIHYQQKKFATNYWTKDKHSYYFRCEKVGKVDYQGKVYDLNVEEDHSYVINNCAVHNSGLGFILLYILGITQVNPLKEDVKTYHWRFLNPKRVSPLDVDVDFENAYRDDVIALLQHKYCGDNQKAGNRRVMKVQTLSTMKAKSALQTACRGLGYASEEGQFLGSFISQERGIQYTLKQTYYGDEENNLPPNQEFKNLMDGQYKDVWEVAQNIEGLISGVGSHAGGVILSATDVVDHAALMKTASGDIITQFDLHAAEKVSLIKWDLLSIDALQKEHVCLNLLMEDGYIKDQGNIRDTYEKYLGVYKIERDNPEIWNMLNEHKVMSFFQMEKQTGYQAIAVAKPESLSDLSALNSVMRLMAPTPRAEAPLDRFGRFKKDITLWYKEMTDYGLTEHEQEVVKKYAEKNYGLLPNQEDFMMVVQDPEVGGFDLLWADKLRKSIA